MVGTSKYAFERYYAEVEKLSGSPDVWNVMGEDQPDNAQYTGFTFNGQSKARDAADQLNEHHKTGFNAFTDEFYDPDKQRDFKKHLTFRKMVKYQEEKMRQTMTTKILKARSPENESASSMTDYPDWGTFGTRSPENISGETYTITMIDTKENYDENGVWIPNDERE